MNITPLQHFNAEQRLRQQEGRGAWVPTEAEKHELSRKRDRSPPPPSQAEQDDDNMEEASSEDDVVMGDERREEARRKLFSSTNGQEEDDEEERAGEQLASLLHAVPDLREYFAQFPSMDTKQVISMCRAYASYLATLTKKEPASGAATRGKRAKKL